MISEGLQEGNKALFDQLAPPSAEKPDRPQLSFLSSLRSRGYLFVALILIYISLTASYFFSQRLESLEQVEQYQLIQKTRAALIQVDLASFHVVTALYSDVNERELRQVINYFSTLGEQYRMLSSLFPQQSATFRKLEKAIPVISADSGREEDLSRILVYLASTKIELDRLMDINQNRMAQLFEEYRRHNDSVLLKTLLLAALGLAIIGGITIFFFSRLKSGLTDLNRRTTEIIRGYRGEPLPVNRQDELGQLTRGINLMSRALTERERALEIEQRRYAFKDKMLAIDSLAGGIAHEVGNPITCIKGLAENIMEDPENRLSNDSQSNLQLLQNYSDSLARFSRDLSSIDMCRADQNEWVNINALISSTVNIYRYDQRWSNVDIELSLDDQVPAIVASPEQLHQLLTHLLENALDATQEQSRPHILVQSRVESQDRISLVIQDNDQGVEEEKLQSIFEPFYTTKPFGEGTGLGLAICWAIITSFNGTIEAESPAEGGLRLTVRLPASARSTSAVAGGLE